MTEGEWNRIPFLVLRLRRTGEDGKTETRHGKVMWPGSHSALVAAVTSNAKEWMLKIHKVWAKGATVTTELSYAEKTKDGGNREIHISDDAGFAAFLDKRGDALDQRSQRGDRGKESSPGTAAESGRIRGAQRCSTSQLFIG